MRKAGSRVRITGQLIDAATGTHLWAERYDRELTDIFAVQDEITSRVVAAIEPALSRAERQRVNREAAGTYGRVGLLPARLLARAQGDFGPMASTAYGLFKEALMLDPNLADAHLALARALIVQWNYGSVEDFAPFVGEAREFALQGGGAR